MSPITETINLFDVEFRYCHYHYQEAPQKRLQHNLDVLDTMARSFKKLPVHSPNQEPETFDHFSVWLPMRKIEAAAIGECTDEEAATIAAAVKINGNCTNGIASTIPATVAATSAVNASTAATRISYASANVPLTRTMPAEVFDIHP